jgi:two-component system, NtrC family, sensor kinase
MKFKITYSFLVALFSLSLQASSIKDNKQSIDSIYILRDSTCQLTVNQVLISKKFKLSEHSIPNLGVSSNVYWLKFTLTNKSDFHNLVLELAHPILDEVDLYTISSNENITVQHSGEIAKYTDRKYKNLDFILDLEIPKDSTRTFLLRIKSDDVIIVPLVAGDASFIKTENRKKDVVFGLYSGVIFVMFLYNLFIYLMVKDASYLYYVIYTLFVGLTQLVLQGFTYEYLWPEFPWFANQSLTLFPSIAGIGLCLFIQKFLDLKTYSPILYKGAYFFIFFYSLAFTTRLIGYNQLSYNIIDIMAGLISIYGIYIGVLLSLKGSRPAKFFLIAWLIFFLGAIVFVLRNFGILPFSNFTNYSMPFGNAIEVILLSFALADRINILKKEKEISQTQALAISLENERLVTNQKIILEREVAERTADLENAYKNLQETQSQLVNSEKMASLGQLTAGVAHEINNPINFVVSNINPLRRDINDIKELLSKYDTLKNDDTYDTRLGDIEKFKKEIDYNYVQEEIEILLKGISEGATRTSEIVKSLKNFSRLDEHDLKKTNINEGIASSIVLLSQQIDTIKVIQNLGQIPEIECFPGKINQAFMNILTNAVEAIHSHRKEGGILEIHTYQQDEFVFATIKDNGTGMPEEVKNKIFEPFFTTKDVGKGTGLGLSITHGIIEKHHGTISIQSEIGNGTMFEIKLPILAPKAK